MPELPEMETYRRLLEEKVLAQKITEVQIHRPKSINMPQALFIQEVQGRQCMSVGRRAKHLLFHLDSGKSLLLHLMLGGWMYWGNETDKPQRTTQIILSFGERSLYFIGLRLGYLHLKSAAEVEEAFSQLGPEPLDPIFTEERFYDMIRAKRGRLKTVLVDQKFIAGIGNCYSDEICFHAGVHPMKKGNELNSEQCSAIYHGILTVLKEAIRNGGYMEHPFFAEDRLTGGYDHQCKVYDREGEPCFRCGQPIIKSELNGRKTFYCPQCQS